MLIYIIFKNADNYLSLRCTSCSKCPQISRSFIKAVHELHHMKIMLLSVNQLTYLPNANVYKQTNRGERKNIMDFRYTVLACWRHYNEACRGQQNQQHMTETNCIVYYCCSMCVLNSVKIKRTLFASLMRIDCLCRVEILTHNSFDLIQYVGNGVIKIVSDMLIQRLLYWAVV